KGSAFQEGRPVLQRGPAGAAALQPLSLLLEVALLHVEKNPFVNQRRLIVANHMYRRLLGYLGTLWTCIHRDQTRMRMDLRPRRNRRDEAQLVGAVVHDVAEPDHLPIIRVFERREQAQREKSVGHWTPERTLLLAAFDIDMNPLMIAGHVGELVNFLLAYLDRFAPAAILLADLRPEPFHIIKTYGFHWLLPGGFVTRAKEPARKACVPGLRRSPSLSRI